VAGPVVSQAAGIHNLQASENVPFSDATDLS
jgi:hypothetical protein